MPTEINIPLTKAALSILPLATELHTATNTISIFYPLTDIEAMQGVREVMWCKTI